MPTNSLTVTDNRTGKSYDLPVQDGCIRAADLRQVKVQADEFGMMSYDPAFLNTAACRSSVTYLDGEQGILQYRGYPIEVLAEHCTFLETAYLLLHGELPAESQLAGFVNQVTHPTMTHENTKKLMDGFHHDAPPTGIVGSTWAALAPCCPDSATLQVP